MPISKYEENYPDYETRKTQRQSNPDNFEGLDTCIRQNIVSTVITDGRYSESGGEFKFGLAFD